MFVSTDSEENEEEIDLYGSTKCKVLIWIFT